MGFWHNVEQEREYIGMPRKELAAKAQISYASISTGLERDSIPAADAALRIAKTLGVPLEYLLTGNESSRTASESAKSCEYSGGEPKIHSSWHKTIRALDSLPKATKESIIQLIESVSQDMKPQTPAQSRTTDGNPR